MGRFGYFSCAAAVATPKVTARQAHSSIKLRRFIGILPGLFCCLLPEIFAPVRV
jgi:hypothetical protein